MARKIRIDMAGARYGRLVGIAFSHRSPSGHAYWEFLCDCDTEVIAAGGNVRAGRTASCGCLHREITAARLTVHGHRARQRHDPTYRAWQLMNDACANPGCSIYRSCGALGISVADAWRSDFTVFMAAMGERPPETILQRIDPAADFGPGNCRWMPARSRAERAVSGWIERRMKHTASSRLDHGLLSHSERRRPERIHPGAYEQLPKATNPAPEHH